MVFDRRARRCGPRPQPGAIAALLLLAGCAIQPKVELVDANTALERQLLGDYFDLDRKALLLTPMRGTPAHLDPATLAYRKAVAGRAFRLDEIDAWKQAGYLTEQSNGLLAPGPKPFPAGEPRLHQRFARLWRLENRDRRFIFRHIIATNPRFASSTVEELGRRFHRMIRTRMRTRPEP
ncbi:MAG: hypothetical protein D6682_00010 [Zetaproteobacteria bacterium]|nr:MAG: hypothetical protein D6682_00010 [Zetaproteobacteria bacterium]